MWLRFLHISVSGFLCDADNGITAVWERWVEITLLLMRVVDIGDVEELFIWLWKRLGSPASIKFPDPLRKHKDYVYGIC